MRREIDEARGLETVQNGPGGCEAFSGRAVKKEGEIHELRCGVRWILLFEMRRRVLTGITRLSLLTASVWAAMVMIQWCSGD